MKEHDETKFQRSTYDTRQAPIVTNLINVNDEVWTVQQLAAKLSLTSGAIVKRIRRGSIPAHKQGNYWYILKSEYIDSLKSM